MSFPWHNTDAAHAYDAIRNLKIDKATLTRDLDLVKADLKKATDEIQSLKLNSTSTESALQGRLDVANENIKFLTEDMEALLKYVTDTTPLQPRPSTGYYGTHWEHDGDYPMEEAYYDDHVVDHYRGWHGKPLRYY